MRKDVDGEVMRAYADLLKSIIPEGWGFALLVFEVNKDSGIGNYISDCPRKDMIQAMESQLANLKKGKDFSTPNHN